jgi:hypothetical protein
MISPDRDSLLGFSIKYRFLYQKKVVVKTNLFNSMQTIPLVLLEYNEGEYQGIKYSNIHARYNGKILKFKLDRNKVGDVSELVDQEVEADVEIVAGNNLAASLKIVAIKAA